MKTESGRANRRMDPFLLEVPAGGGRSVSRPHEGEEFLIVLGGRVTLEYGAESFALETGDSLYFDADTPHRLHHLLMDLVQVGGLLHADDVVPGHPISLSQAFALHELDIEGGLSQGDLAQRLRLEKSSASRMAADLERKALLVRERARLATLALVSRS